jgi:hypothetical protein
MKRAILAAAMIILAGCEHGEYMPATKDQDGYLRDSDGTNLTLHDLGGNKVLEYGYDPDGGYHEWIVDLTTGKRTGR